MLSVIDVHANSFVTLLRRRMIFQFEVRSSFFS